MLVRVPVPHAAARKIQGMILSGELKSGEKVPSQREFAQALKVSRASLREALLTLETLGLLKTEPGRGTFVSQEPPSASRNMARWRYGDSYPVSDVFETRIMLEGRIAGLSAHALTDGDLDGLDRATDDMERHWEMGDLLVQCRGRPRVPPHHRVGLPQPDARRPLPVGPRPADRDAAASRSRSPSRRACARRSASTARIIAALRLRDAVQATFEMQRHILNTARCAGVDLSVSLR